MDLGIGDDMSGGKGEARPHAKGIHGVRVGGRGVDDWFG